MWIEPKLKLEFENREGKEEKIIKQTNRAGFKLFHLGPFTFSQCGPTAEPVRRPVGSWCRSDWIRLTLAGGPHKLDSPTN